MNLDQDLKMEIIQKLSGLSEVKQVILFGSRARGDARERSDIDLAVAAPELKLKQWFKIFQTVEGLNTLLPVDLIWLEEASEDLRAKILTEGEVLYERN
jgi:predicted nucleotidyltransferase